MRKHLSVGAALFLGTMIFSCGASRAPVFVHLLGGDGLLLFAETADGTVYGGPSLNTPIPALSGATTLSAALGAGSDALNGALSGPDLWACASLQSGNIVCAGDDTAGELGPIAPESCSDNGGIELDELGAIEFPRPTVRSCADSLSLGSCFPCVLGWTTMPGMSGITQVGRNCAVDVAGKVLCWAGWAPPNSLPGPVAGISPPYAVLKSGDIYSLIDGTQVPLAGVSWLNSSYGSPTTTCAVTFDNKLYCWGANESGQIGDGTFINHDLPTPIGSGYVSVRVTGKTTCALTVEKTVRCWGLFGDDSCGSSGVCGVSPSPVDVSGLAGVRELASAKIGLLEDGRIFTIRFAPDGPTFSVAPVN